MNQSCLAAAVRDGLACQARQTYISSGGWHSEASASCKIGRCHMPDMSIQAVDASQPCAPRSKLSYECNLKSRNLVCGIVREGEQRIGRSAAGYPVQVVTSDSLRWGDARCACRNVSSASKCITGRVMQDVAWPEACPRGLGCC